jgi:DNA-binding MarR family transcriptional regulator
MNRTATVARVSPAVEAWQLLMDFFLQLEPYWDELASDIGLSSSQAHALILLDPDAPVPMSRLATKCGFDPSNLTGIVDRLEARGLVERRPDAHDRRVKLLAVTADGRRVREQALAKAYAPPPAIAKLSTADQRTLRDLLRRAFAE